MLKKYQLNHPCTAVPLMSVIFPPVIETKYLSDMSSTQHNVYVMSCSIPPTLRIMSLKGYVEKRQVIFISTPMSLIAGMGYKEKYWVNNISLTVSKMYVMGYI